MEIELVPTFVVEEKDENGNVIRGEGGVPTHTHVVNKLEDFTVTDEMREKYLVDVRGNPISTDDPTYGIVIAHSGENGTSIDVYRDGMSTRKPLVHLDQYQLKSQAGHCAHVRSYETTRRILEAVVREKGLDFIAMGRLTGSHESQADYGGIMQALAEQRHVPANPRAVFLHVGTDYRGGLDGRSFKIAQTLLGHFQKGTGGVPLYEAGGDPEAATHLARRHKALGGDPGK